jgi:hypothetical protein
VYICVCWHVYTIKHHITTLLQWWAHHITLPSDVITFLPCVSILYDFCPTSKSINNAFLKGVCVCVSVCVCVWIAYKSIWCVVKNLIDVSYYCYCYFIILSHTKNNVLSLETFVRFMLIFPCI